MPEMAAFQGFADPTCKFWKELAKKQDRAYFEAHKAEFKEGWEQPMHALLGELGQKLDGAYPDCDLAEPKVFRIYRDVRFSKDKSPFKTHIGGCLYLKLGADKVTATPSPLYLQVGTENMAAAGLYEMGPQQLAKFRAAVLADKTGKELASMVAKLEKAGFSLDRSLALKRAPKGVDPEHPRAELAKQRGFGVMFPAFEPKLLGSRELVKHLTAQGKAIAPLVRWLAFATA